MDRSHHKARPAMWMSYEQTQLMSGCESMHKLRKECTHVALEVMCMQLSINGHPRSKLGHHNLVSGQYVGASGGIRIGVFKGYSGSSGRGFQGVSGGIRGYPHNFVH